MAQPYDATVKALLETNPADWPAFFGRPATGPVRVIDADLSTVTTAADKVLFVEDPIPWLLHIEFQSARDPWLAERLLKYNALLLDRHRIPVESVVILLRRQADVPALDGSWRYVRRLDGREQAFPYTLVRLWQQPVETILWSGTTTLPLAPLADLRKSELAGVVRRIGQRLRTEVTDDNQRRLLWTSTYILSGMRYSATFVEQMFTGVLDMEESSTYQAIMSKGRASEARKLCDELGEAKFGQPDPTIRAALDAISDVARLETLVRRVLTAESWQELLATPARPRRQRRPRS